MFRGSGVSLSPLDHALLREWADLDVPFEVVARGLHKAAEQALWDARPGDEVLRSLRSCRKAVTGEIRRYRDRAVGRASPSRNRALQDATGPETRSPSLSRPDSPSATATSHDASASAETGYEDERRRRCVQTLRKFAVDHPLLQHLAEPLCAWLSSLPRDDAAFDVKLETALLRGLPYVQRRDILVEANAWVSQGFHTSHHARLRSWRFHRAAVLRRVLSLPSFW